FVADQLIVATGAYERPVAFPGWTLPGVMSANGARRLIEQGVQPGARVLVGGCGGPARAAAELLRTSGANVVDVVDPSEGRMVVRAAGSQALERVSVANVDADWYPAGGSEQTLEVDALVLAYGLLPENQLARLAGCAPEGSEYVG